VFAAVLFLFCWSFSPNERKRPTDEIESTMLPQAKGRLSGLSLADVN
jgi:hypothetical protein